MILFFNVFTTFFSSIFVLKQVNAHRTIHSSEPAKNLKNFEFINFIRLQNYGQFESASKNSKPITPGKERSTRDEFKKLPAHLKKNNTAYVQFDQQQQLHIDLISLGHFFSIILFPSFQLPVIAKHFNRSIHLNVTCYNGFLKNHPTSTQLFAYFHNNLLNAIIQAYNDIYHLEELSNQTVIMYRESDIDLNDDKYFDLNKSNNSSSQLSNSKKLANESKLKDNLIQTQNSFPNRRKLLFANRKNILYPYRASICDMELISDHTFSAFFRHDRVRISAELFLMLMYANWIFSQSDFNQDNRPDGITLQLARIIIYHTQYERDYTWADTNLDPYQIINKFGLRIQTHCLSFVFMVRDFTKFGEPLSGTLGLAWVSTPHNHQGICGKPSINPSVSKNKLWCGNTGIITVLERRRVRARAETSSTFAHEVGHSFGTEHDDNPEVIRKYGKCPPVYLMSANDQKLLTKSQFSRCSKMQIDPVLRTRSTCFRPYQSRCGNAFKEVGEECDCGPDMVCSIIDPCCEPSTCRIKQECKNSHHKKPFYNYYNYYTKPTYRKPNNPYYGVLNRPQIQKYLNSPLTPAFYHPLSKMILNQSMFKNRSKEEDLEENDINDENLKNYLEDLYPDLERDAEEGYKNRTRKKFKSKLTLILSRLVNKFLEKTDENLTFILIIFVILIVCVCLFFMTQFCSFEPKRRHRRKYRRLSY